MQYAIIGDFYWQTTEPMTRPTLLRIALPVPLRRSFDYLLPEGSDDQALPQPGCRVEARFGNRRLTGVVLALTEESEVPAERLKSVHRVIDASPVIPAELLALAQWAASYYQCPIGEAVFAVLPVRLRQGESAVMRSEPVWQLTTKGKGLPEGALARAPKQALLLALLQQHQTLTDLAIREHGIAASILRQLRNKELIEAATPAQTPATSRPLLREQPLPATPEQQAALNALSLNGFQVSLLDGTTGSGKTEVYLQAISRVLQQGRQALVLVPEIGLTPQTVSRFTRRFGTPVVTLHSGLSDRERLDAWLQAGSGTAGIIIGTRSAVFTPLANPGIIIIDEEHDGSFKQQDGFRYSARDVAIMRASKLDIPLLLGSATPALETLNHALTGRYQHLRLTRRAGEAQLPEVRLVELRGKPLQDGFAPETLEAIASEIDKGQQVLVFINRRGFAPTLQCHDCGWMAACQHCDARMTLHYQPRHLRCHHCDHQRPVPARCPECRGYQLQPLGQGTERSEQALQARFPYTRILRIDRDSTRRKGSMEAMLNSIQEGKPCILVGTQMLAKGHHFPDVTLVVIIDADAGLFSADFRGPERMGQLLLQVAGRAGRADKPGRVILQSHHTDHPLVQTLMYQGYHALADIILSERRLTAMPPFRHLALIRAESKAPEQAMAFLQYARQQVEILNSQSPASALLGPLPALMEKRGDRFRYLLQLANEQRKPLQYQLARLARQLEEHPLGKRLRWSIDVDPLEMN